MSGDSLSVRSEGNRLILKIETNKDEATTNMDYTAAKNLRDLINIWLETQS